MRWRCCGAGLLVLGVLGCGGGGGAGSAGGPVPKLLQGSAASDFRVKPPAIVYTGDGTGSLGAIRRRVWNGRLGAGTAIDSVRGCDPSCAQGRLRRGSARVRVIRVRAWRFTRLEIRDRVSGHQAVRRFSLTKTAPGGNRYAWVGAR